MLSMLTKLGDWFGRAAQPDVEDDFDPENLDNWYDIDDPPTTEGDNDRSAPDLR